MANGYDHTQRGILHYIIGLIGGGLLIVYGACLAMLFTPPAQVYWFVGVPAALAALYAMGFKQRAGTPEATPGPHRENTV